MRKTQHTIYREILVKSQALKRLILEGRDGGGFAVQSKNLQL